MNSVDVIFSQDVISGRLYSTRWMQKENFPKELIELNYRATNTYKTGPVSAVHFRREQDTN